MLIHSTLKDVSSWTLAREKVKFFSFSDLGFFSVGDGIPSFGVKNKSLKFKSFVNARLIHLVPAH